MKWKAISTSGVEGHINDRLANDVRQSCVARFYDQDLLLRFQECVGSPHVCSALAVESGSV